MKTLLNIIFFTIIAGIMLSSCKHVSVIKRKYNNGYYISHSGKRADVKKHDIAENEKPDFLKPVSITSTGGEPKKSDLKEYPLVADAGNMIDKKDNTETHSITPKKIKASDLSLKAISLRPIKIFKEESC